MEGMLQDKDGIPSPFHSDYKEPEQKKRKNKQKMEFNISRVVRSVYLHRQY